jgi:hypothetical protein
MGWDFGDGGEGIVVNEIAGTNLAKDAIDASAGGECRRLVAFPGLAGGDLTPVPTTQGAMVAAALSRLVQRTHARLAVLSISGVGHLGAGDARLPGAFPVADPVRSPGAGLGLEGPGARARLLGDSSPSSRSLASLDEPGVEAVLDFIGVVPGHPLLAPLRTRYATGHSDELGEVALLAVADAAITRPPRWAVTLIWSSGAPPPRGDLEALFGTLSESLNPAPPAIDAGAPRVVTLAPGDLAARLAMLLQNESLSD